MVDDDSSDGTAAVIMQSNLPLVRVIKSKSLLKGWTSKLGAQEQGLKEVWAAFTRQAAGNSGVAEYLRFGRY